MIINLCRARKNWLKKIEKVDMGVQFVYKTNGSKCQSHGRVFCVMGGYPRCANSKLSTGGHKMADY